jgi:hypothetical protein
MCCNVLYQVTFSSSSSIGTTALSWVSACSTIVEHSQQEGFTECRCQRHVKPPTWRRKFYFSVTKYRGDNAPISTNNKSPTAFNVDQQYNISFIGPTDPGIKHAVRRTHSPTLEAELRLHSFINSTLVWLNPNEVLRLQPDVSVLFF